MIYQSRSGGKLLFLILQAYKNNIPIFVGHNKDLYIDYCRRLNIPYKIINNLMFVGGSNEQV